MLDLIVQFLNGDGDSIITTGSANLSARRGGAQACPIINIPSLSNGASPGVVPPLQGALAQATSVTRIYLRGHGNWKLRTLGGWTAGNVAALLNANGLTTARVLSITGCNAARSEAAGAPKSIAMMEYRERVAEAESIRMWAKDSFAGRLFRELERLGIDIPVTGRVYSVDVEETGHKKVVIGGDTLAKPGVGSARFSKLVFRKVSGEHRVEWVQPGENLY